ncbi:hypothetical protein V6N13_069819 [Hibiscus sabdariffa]|uniref:Uncharacterized protein n=1 Tax=Hibiscus sabdariffa TaxID=183260 RepID=A0ABR2BIQ1_9ROSI
MEGLPPKTRGLRVGVPFNWQQKGSNQRFTEDLFNDRVAWSRDEPQPRLSLTGGEGHAAVDDWRCSGGCF